MPAVLYKEQITKEFQKLYYTEDMLFETGCLEQWRPEIEDIPSAGRFDYAIVSGNKLIGFLSYQVDYYCSSAYNFGLMSFDRGNPIIGKDVFEKLEELVSTLHRVEWRMIGGNPAERGYDAFCERHNGNKHIFKDSIRDAKGNYRNDIVPEIFKNVCLLSLSGRTGNATLTRTSTGTSTRSRFRRSARNGCPIMRCRSVRTS